MSAAESRLSPKQVHILENRNLTHLRVPALRRHEVSVADGDESRTHESQRGHRHPDVRVAGGPEEGSPRAVVRYRPKLSELQKRLRSRHALQFVVEYDVDRKDVGGEVQVSMEQTVFWGPPEISQLQSIGQLLGCMNPHSALRTVNGEIFVSQPLPKSGRCPLTESDKLCKFDCAIAGQKHFDVHFSSLTYSM